MYSVLMAEIGINLPTVVKYMLVGKIEIPWLYFLRIPSDAKIEGLPETNETK